MIYAKPTKKSAELNAKLAERKALRGKASDARDYQESADLEKAGSKEDPCVVHSCVWLLHINSEF
jgi:hypothetical protein